MAQPPVGVLTTASRARFTPGGQQREVGADLGLATDPGSAPAVTTAHQVPGLAFHLRPGGPVVRDPARITLPGNAGDASLAEDLIGDLLADTAGTDTGAAEACGDDTGGDPAAKRGAGPVAADAGDGAAVYGRQRLWDWGDP